MVDRAVAGLPPEEQRPLLGDARAPFLPAALGPLAWTGGGALLVWELAKPAHRKLVPALLFIGLLTLRKPSETRSPDRS